MEDSSVLYYLLIVLVLLLAWYDFYKKKNFIKKNGKNIPVLPFLPWIGSAYLFVREIQYVYRIFEKAIRIVGSDYFFGFNWYMPVYATINADDLQVILPNVLERGFLANLLVKNVMGNCLLTNEVSRWRVNRKIINKSFKQQSLNAKITSINEAVNEYLTTVKNTERGVEMLEANKRFFMESFITQYFPHFQAVDKHVSDIIFDTIKAVNDICYARAIKPWLHIEYFFNMTKMKKNLDRLQEQANQLAHKGLDDVRKSQDEGTASEDSDDVVINLEKGGNDRDLIISEIKFLIGAATDTQGIAFTMVIIALGIYPDIQEKILNEVLEVVGPTDFVNQHHLQHLKYTEMVIKETLRLCPPISMVPKKTKSIINLGNGKVLPKDLEIFISIYNIHRNEKYWKNPLEFNPDRFLPEEVEKRHPFAFIPFSSGPRNCIGYKYAMITQVISVALFVRKYKICTPTSTSILDIEMKPFITLEMVDKKVVCTFTPRR